jgi:hypothetical protein
VSEATPLHKIYLDLDGVIFPHWHKSDGGRVQVEKDGPYLLRSELQVGLTTNWVDKQEFYYPDITKRLGNIASRGVQIIPSSSRSSDLIYSEGVYDDVLNDIGGVDRYLVIDSARSNVLDHKARAVLNNWHGVTDWSIDRRGWERLSSTEMMRPVTKSAAGKAVWIDDLANIDRINQADRLRITTDPSIKVIRPLGTIGLTMVQLDEVEDFLFREDTRS